MIGIYSITNTKNRRIYIGASANIDRRWQEHLYYLRHNQHTNRQLQNDWNQQQERDFEFAVIRTCQADELTRLELQTIRATQRTHNAYNQYEGDPEATTQARTQMSRADWQGGVRVEEVARLLKLNPRTIRRMIDRESIIAYKMDPNAKSVYRIPRTEVDRLLRERNPTPDAS